MKKPRLSLQLYAIRDAYEADPAAALDRAAQLGFRDVEVIQFTGRAAEVRRGLDAAGVAAPSGHAMFLTDSFRFGEHVIEVPPLERILDDAAEIGIEVLIDPMTAPERWQDAAGIAGLAERLNVAAVEAAKRGIRVGFHNHAHEFAHSFDEVSAYETLIAQLEPSVVVELDAYWAKVGGQDAVTLADRLGDRLVALHVKDGDFSEDAEGDPRQVPAGTGDAALEQVLERASALELAIVEYDEVAGDVFDAVEASARFLTERGIR